MEFDFEQWQRLARDDPDEFERSRHALIEAAAAIRRERDRGSGWLAWIIHEGLGMIARRFARQVGLDRRSQ